MLEYNLESVEKSYQDLKNAVRKGVKTNSVRDSNNIEKLGKAGEEDHLPLHDNLSEAS